MEHVDLTIVGAGPVGLYGAYYAGFRGLTVAVIDSLEKPGGQIAALYPEKQIHDVAGFPSITGQHLVNALFEQASTFAVHWRLGHQATALQNDGDVYLVHVAGGETIRTGAIVVAGGIGTFTPRMLPGSDHHIDRGVDYFVPDLSAYAGRSVTIVGGGDSAVDWALALEPIADEVRLVHRRGRFRAHAASVDKLMLSGVEVVLSSTVSGFVGDDWLREIEITDLDSGSSSRVACDAVIAALGFTANLGPLEAWGMEIVDRRILVDSRMRTNLPRLYAAGDISEYPGKVRLIAVGFGEVATAVNNAAVELDPSLELFPGHSTELTH